MTDARELTRAERCSLFLLDKEQRELVAKVFDGHLAEDGQETCTEVRIPANQGKFAMHQKVLPPKKQHKQFAYFEPLRLIMQVTFRITIMK